ncbi:unnamed protein product [Phytophthora fragariaefolia]|uniref:Unnamed protein product n=1 Tax=Phytophthora fragariaefolia TaxID=1490495 RepID=A0A9W6X7E6_9STRA|nr:unnamed protein product [Phytophthora fragariaefolia]
MRYAVDFASRPFDHFQSSEDPAAYRQDRTVLHDDGQWGGPEPAPRFQVRRAVHRHSVILAIQDAASEWYPSDVVAVLRAVHTHAIYEVPGTAPFQEIRAMCNLTVFSEAPGALPTRSLTSDVFRSGTARTDLSASDAHRADIDVPGAPPQAPSVTNGFPFVSTSAATTDYFVAAFDGGCRHLTDRSAYAWCVWSASRELLHWEVHAFGDAQTNNAMEAQGLLSCLRSARQRGRTTSVHVFGDSVLIVGQALMQSDCNAVHLRPRIHTIARDLTSEFDINLFCSCVVNGVATCVPYDVFTTLRDTARRFDIPFPMDSAFVAAPSPPFAIPRSNHGIVSGMAGFGWTSSPGIFAVFGKAVRHYQRTGASSVLGYSEPFWIFQWVDDIVLIEVDIGERLQKAEQCLRDGVKLVFGLAGWHEGKLRPVPQRKIKKMRGVLDDVAMRKFVTMKQLDSLVGVIRHVISFIPVTKPFIQRLVAIQIRCRERHKAGVPMMDALQKDIQRWRELGFENKFAGIPMELFERRAHIDDVWLVQIQQHGLTISSMVLGEAY